MRVACVLAVVLVGCGGSGRGAARAAEAAADDCEPGRCMADIAERIEAYRPEARACYDAGYLRDPTIGGILVINFEIGPDGAVIGASQSLRDDQLTDAEVAECVASVIRDIQFAKSARGKSTRGFHRYEFSPP